jgi:hypothetical protein
LKRNFSDLPPKNPIDKAESRFRKEAACMNYLTLAALEFSSGALSKTYSTGFVQS